MNYVKNNRTKVIVLSAMFVSSLIHRSGIITTLLSDDEPDKPTSSAEASVASVAEQNAVVNLRHFNWPDSNLENILSHSPFGIERPPEPSAEELAETEAALAESLLEQPQEEVSKKSDDEPVYVTQRLKVVLHGGKGSAAIVGSRVVRVGDSLEDGSRIVAIRDRKLILEPQPPTAETASATETP